MFMKKLLNLWLLCVLCMSCHRDKMDVPLGDAITKEDLQELRIEIEKDTAGNWEGFYSVYTEISTGMEVYKNNCTPEQWKTIRSYTYRDVYEFGRNISDKNNPRTKQLSEEYRDKYGKYLSHIDKHIEIAKELIYKHEHGSLTPEEKELYYSIPFEYKYYIDNPSDFTYSLIGQKVAGNLWMTEANYIAANYDDRMNKLFKIITEISGNNKGD